MQDHVLFTDSTTDLSPALIEEMDAVVMPLSFTLNDKSYQNHPDGREMPMADFYTALRRGGMSSTSLLTMETLRKAFAPVLEQGKDVLYLAFSSGLSGTYQTACITAQDLMEEYPGRRVVCVDTLQASMGEGLLTFEAALLRKQGKSLDEVADYVRTQGQSYCAWFTVEDLMFLKRGGRVSGAAAVAGTLLGIKPVLHVDREGKLIPMEKVRGRRASLDALVKHYKDGVLDKTGTVFISHGDCLADAQYVADKIRAIGAGRIELNMIGPVIGAHSGPGTVALFYRGTNR